MKNPVFRFSVILITSMHFFGFVFMQIESTKALFVSLTPLNLLVSTALLLFFHRDWNKNFLLFCGITALGGYAAEVAGVHTELIFGKYAYGNTLGIKVLEVPILIAANWLLLTYSINGVVSEFWNWQVKTSAKAPDQTLNWQVKTLASIPIWTKIVLSAFLMTSLDFFIEPFAIENDLWHWYGQPVPFQNYAAWFVFSAIFSGFFQFFSFSKSNSLAKWIWFSQLFFFLAHYLNF